MSRPPALPFRSTRHFCRASNTLKQGSEVEYGFLGVSMPQPDDPVPRASPGAVVVGRAGGYARRARPLETGDVITHVNGRAVHDRDELLLHVGKLPPDASVRLTVERGGPVAAIRRFSELAKFGVARQARS